MTESGELGCEQALEYLFDYLDKELVGSVREDMEKHLKTCRSCFSRYEFEKRLKRRMSQLADTEVPDSLKERVHRIIGKY